MSEEYKVRFVIEPNRFQRLLENVLMYHQNVELDAIAGLFNPKGASFFDMSLEVLLLNSTFSSKYFLEYKCNEKEVKVPLSKSLLEWMKQAFGNDEKITVTVTEQKISIEGKTEKYEEDLTEVEMKPPTMAFVAHEDDVESFEYEEGEEFPFELLKDDSVVTIGKKEIEMGKIIKGKGILPKKLNPTVQVLIKSEALAGLPKVEQYRIHCDKKSGEIKISIEGVGKYTKEVKLQRTELIEDLEMVFGSKYFNKVVAQFSGELWLTLRPEAAVFSQKNKDSLLTYLLSSSD